MNPTTQAMLQAQEAQYTGKPAPQPRALTTILMMLEAQEAMILGRPIPVETILWKMANAEEHRIRQVLWQAKREAAPKPNNKPTITEGVHVCRVCGLETPATGADFYYPAAPACGHYTESGHPNTEYRPAPPPTPVMTGPPPKVGSVLQEPPMPDAKPRRDVGPRPQDQGP
jgi:hypothetical protein